VKRHLFNALAAVSMVLCVAILAIWLCGGWVDNSGRFKPLPGRWEFTSDGHRGFMQIVLLHHSNTRIVGPIIPSGSSAVWDAWERRFPPKVRVQNYADYGFGFEYGPLVAVDATHHAMEFGTRTWVMLPFGFVAALFGTLPIVALFISLRRRSSVRQGMCAACGYDLRATPERCPECGVIPAKME
jgi:hypothetical protein